MAAEDASTLPDKPLDPSPAEAAECERWIREHSRSFYLASRLLPGRVRRASWALYAFCRRTDDAVDDEAAGDEKARRLEALSRRLDLVYPGGGEASPGAPGLDAVDRAYAAVAAAHGLPRALPEALLEGMAMDARGERYGSMEDLYLYCFRVASTVGLMMTLVMGAEGRGAFLRAAELGLAMQLTNIARDVGEDARRGRVYLPDELLSACGTTRARVLSASSADWPLRNATRRLLARADDFYRSADRGIPLLPSACRPSIAAARKIYAAIGDDLARHGHDPVVRRAHTSTARKLLLSASSLPALLPSPSAERAALSPGPIDDLLAGWIDGCGVSLSPPSATSRNHLSRPRP